MTTVSNESEHSYVFDSESASEIARLLERDEFLTKAMGEPFPERIDLEGVTRILDIGCGTGGWALDVASSYPSIEVVGIDISEAMLTSARDKAQQRQLLNVTFQKMDALQLLQFPSQYFSLVNMRAAVEYVPRDKWRALLQECYRITQPGGILRLTEADRLAHTNSLAFEKYSYFYAKMLFLRGYGFSIDGWTLGMTPMLGNLLRDAVYRHTHMK
jgi:ubiquinone/menaquinone biosynthesis C-methylase UbiE